jgi:hypothetical protein
MLRSGCKVIQLLSFGTLSLQQINIRTYLLSNVYRLNERIGVIDSL